MDGLSYLMMFCCFAFVCSHGRVSDLAASCEVMALVRRHTTWKAAPQQSLTVRCPVKHCGRTINITWCKDVQSNRCEQLNETENVELSQNHNQANDELESYLSFKQISIYDDGLYRCKLNGDKLGIFSHFINISVSDKYQGVEMSKFEGAKLPSADGEDDYSWLPYFCITVSILLLIVTLPVITMLRFYGWRRILTISHTKGEEMPTHMIPSLPKWTHSSSPVLHSCVFTVNDIYSSATPEILKSPPDLSPTADQTTVSNTADKSQLPPDPVYAVINHRQPGMADRKQNAAPKEDKNPQYAVVKVP
ncbi:B- and T-lymphocyte attenuator [Acanthochromis polyacanthus]|uniref:B- and T-lymphocyte attenuator n=1 Tax=Acanthochromis polyacanthus TaxID=80966 RepID=UPI0022343835|nr:B- and T-lymphocyte attenuator [Acanthochromis polyacanthus]